MRLSVRRKGAERKEEIQRVCVCVCVKREEEVEEEETDEEKKNI